MPRHPAGTQRYPFAGSAKKTRRLKKVTTVNRADRAVKRRLGEEKSLHPFMNDGEPGAANGTGPS